MTHLAKIRSVIDRLLQEEILKTPRDGEREMKRGHTFSPGEAIWFHRSIILVLVLYILADKGYL